MQGLGRKEPSLNLSVMVINYIQWIGSVKYSKNIDKVNFTSIYSENLKIFP